MALRKVLQVSGIVDGVARTAKVSYCSVWAEFCVKFYEAGTYLESAGYFTQDKADAIATAKHWTGSDKGE